MQSDAERTAQFSTLSGSAATGQAATERQADASLDHLLLELSRVDRVIRGHVAQARAEGRKDDEFRRLYISDDDVETMLRAPLAWRPGNGRWKQASAEGEPPKGFEGRSDDVFLLADAQTARPVGFCLARLSDAFGLAAFDLDVMLLCLAPELDTRYECLYAYLQDDVTRKLPTVDLALKLLCRSQDETLVGWKRFASEAPLLTHRIISLHENQGSPGGPLRDKSVKLDERIFQFESPEPTVAARSKALDAVRQQVQSLLSRF